MTDKQMIIDGVDVSGCKYYDDLDCYAERDNCGYPLDCKDTPNCHFKQLVRKTQECEQKEKGIKYLLKCLDNSFKIQQDSELHWEKERKKLKAEIEELKEKSSEWKTFDVVLGNDFSKIYKDIKLERDRAEQKLEKIKDYVYSNTDFDKDDSIQSKTAGYDILQIIDEVV